MEEEEKDNGIKISMPLITNLELQEIDNNMNNIVEQFTKAYIHDKELAIAQHIIETQKVEIEELNRENERQYELLCNIHNKNEQEKVDLRLQYIAEIKKKDRMIEAMANDIYIVVVKEDGNHFNTVEDVIEYYTKLAEEKK